MNENTKSSGNVVTPVNNPLVRVLNIGFICGIFVYLLLILCIFYAQNQPLYVLVVATAALNFGAFIGFLYSTYGSEEKKFSQLFVTINGVLGGATATDLFHRNTSLIFKALERITVGCGLDASFAGAVLVVIVTCAPVGFFWLYFNRKLILNPEMHQASYNIEKANTVMDHKPLEILSDPGMQKPSVDLEVKTAAKIITEDKNAINSDRVGVLVNLGRSFYELGKYEEAIAPLEKALTMRPNQSDALLALASAMLNINKNEEAIPVLEKLTSLSIVPTLAWKLLGYAYLFYPETNSDRRQKLEKAIEASRKYLAFEKSDYGAKLNLACAYGQLGPEYPDATKEVVSLIKEILAGAPNMKERIQELKNEGQDFEKWTNVGEFKALIP